MPRSITEFEGPLPVSQGTMRCGYLPELLTRRRRVTPRAPRTYHPPMSNGDLHWIANYIWGIADDVLRDLYVRGKYRDVILPMTVLRRLDAVLEGSKQAVLDMKATLDAAGVVEQDAALRQAAGQAFYNTSTFTLRDLRARASRQQLRADVEAYLDGFSPNVQDILENFEFRNQIPRLSKADALGTLIEKITSPDVNLSPAPVTRTTLAASATKPQSKTCRTASRSRSGCASNEKASSVLSIGKRASCMRRWMRRSRRPVTSR